MKSALLDAMLNAPDLPELIGEAQRALGREQKLREKFYADITPEHKWEFIQGEAIRHSPALNRHLAASERLLSLLDAFVRVHRLGLVRHEKAMTSFPRNDYEPDVMFFGSAKAALIDPDTLRFPIPDFIAEVLSPSTEARDRGIKFRDYALHSVAEYWIIDTVAETVEPYRLADGEYPPTPAQAEGMLSSEVVPGFEMPLRALFDEEENARVMKRIWAGA
jgi:Uma2 family endonuclease